MHRWWIVCSLLVCAGSPPALAQIAFDPEQVVSTDVTQPSDLAVADLDDDGILDLVVMEAVPGLLSEMWVFPGVAGGGFLPPVNLDLTTLLIPLRVFAADFAGDALPDILVIEASTNGEYRLFTNQGGLSFSMTSGTLSSGLFTTNGHVADLDEDGNMDVITTRTSLAGAATGRVFFGTGSGSFSGGPTLSLSSTVLSVVSTDLDGDLDLDLVFGHNTGGGGGLSICQADAPGSWPSCTFVPGPLGVWNLIAGDFNGDGNPDLAGNANGQGNVFVAPGNGDGTLGSLTSAPVGEGVFAIDAADVDGDDHLDIVAFSNEDEQIDVIRGDGNGGLVPALTLTATDPFRGLIADVDQDSDGDFLTVSISGQVSLFTNESTPVDPSSPSFIRGDADGDGIFNGLLDGLYMLDHQFQGGPPLPCLESGEADGDGIFNGLVDALYALNHQFGGGPAPAAPYPACGLDPAPVSSVGCLDDSACP